MTGHENNVDLQVYLDAWRDAPEGWVRVNHVKEVIALLSVGRVKKMSLDYELADCSETGYDVVVWLATAVAGGLALPESISVHSIDLHARARMEWAIKQLYCTYHAKKGIACVKENDMDRKHEVEELKRMMSEDSIALIVLEACAHFLDKTQGINGEAELYEYILEDKYPEWKANCDRLRSALATAERQDGW